MKTVKVSEASGIVLDWLVAKCEGEDYSPVITYSGIGQEFPATNYSTDWSLAGPIIDKYLCELLRCESHCGNRRVVWWEAACGTEGEPGHVRATGDTPLIAAMRCYVASKLGEEVEVPEELVCRTATAN